ncbi:hypothetical protein VTN77DRAFT_8122 [Rasamsonia byssochlamydoides]|uniref:uncharacterized protein n=1 Tax=Rasamsonia byssochlamydoides TaxID=89139 RepID=UPI0037426E1A
MQSSECPSPLLKLPPELILSILHFLPDVSTLRSAILSHSSFHLVFGTNNDAIITRFLSRVVSAELLPEALAVWVSSRVQRWTPERVSGVLSLYRSRRRIVRLRGLSLVDALAIEELHLCVCSFVDMFAAAALSEHPFTERLETRPSPLSSSEWRRVASSFYRAELCTNLFRPRGSQYAGSPYRHIPDILLNHFHVWEIEQLGCVSEFVYRELCKRLKGDMDITWGRSSLGDTDVVIWEGQKRQFFSCGLRVLRQLLALDSANERCALLAPRLHSSRHFLQHAVWHVHAELDNYSHDGDWSGSQGLFDDDRDNQVEVLTGSPLSEDLDLGPAAAFTWVTELLGRRDFVCSLTPLSCRARGYVMWDYTRLATWGFFKDPWGSTSAQDSVDIN